MDNTDSEMIESLNILRPPVRRDFKTSRFGYQPNAINFMSEWRKPKKRIKGGKRVRRHLNSSTSLVLKRTSDSQIFDRYPVVSYTNTSIQPQRTTPSVVKFDVKEKPVIKVIVVPNDQPSEGKQSERNKLTRNIFINSDDNNAIETKNVYLVVTGRGKKDKIYEIKTTESDTLSPTELKHDSVSKAFNGDCFKQIIKALNMERKKTNQMPVDEVEYDHVCKCSCNRPEFNFEGPVHEIDAGRSKVRIYGQLGLTEDDRYILKCNATVDDKPVPTTFSTVGQRASEDLVPPQRMQTNSRPFREPANAQAYEQRKSMSRPRIEYTPENDYSPRRSQPRDTPRMTRESQRRPVEYPPANDMAPRRTHQPQRLTDEAAPENDMAPRRTQQTQRRITGSPPENDMVSRRTQQTQRRITGSPPGNDMAPRRTHHSQRLMDEAATGNDLAPRRTQQSQRRTTDYPQGNDIVPRRTQQTQRRMDEYAPVNDMAPRRTQQSQRRMDDSPGNDMAPRRTQQSQRMVDESYPGNDMAPRRTQQLQRMVDESYPGNDMAPRRTQQSQRMVDESYPGNDMVPRRTQQSQRMVDESLPVNDMAPRRTQQSQRPMDEYPTANYMDPRKTRESQRKTLTGPPGNVLEYRDPNETRESYHRNISRETGNLAMSPRQTRQSLPRSVMEERLKSHDSHATQATMRKYSNYDYSKDNYADIHYTDNARKSHASTIDKDTQCACDCDDPNELKETQSPLVIISVYPNPDVECEPVNVSENVEAHIYEHPPAGFSGGQRRSSPRQLSEHVPVVTALKDADVQEGFGRSRIFIRKSYRIPNRSTTPQNKKNNNTNDQNQSKQNKVIETRMVKTNARSQSPFKSPSNIISVRSNTSKTVKIQETKKTTESKQKINASTKHSRNTQISKIKSKSRSKDKYNKNQMKPNKSLLAEKHKKAINERVEKYNRMSPKHNVSAVSINIDSENDYYDVTFHQGKYITDLLVRKTSKHLEKQNDSKVNFLPKSIKSTPIYNQFTENIPNNDIPRDETTLKLNPRDSLEISHRHNVRTEIETQTRIEHNNSVSKDDMHYFAPVKHFTGDDCVICDPLARDREIQQLLGVPRRVVSSQTTDVQDMFGYKHIITQHCFSDEKECKDILYSAVEFEDSICSCCCVRRSCCRNLKIKCYKRSSANKIKRNASERHQVEEMSTETKDFCNELPRKIANPKKHPEENKKTLEETDSFDPDDEIDELIDTPMKKPEGKKKKVEEKKKKPEEKWKTVDEIDSFCCDDGIDEPIAKSMKKPEEKKKKLEEKKKKPEEKKKKLEEKQKKAEKQKKEQSITENEIVEHKKPKVERTSLYQQLILNRNIHVFLQVEQFCKQKPICLSKEQYNKVKKTIQDTLNKDKPIQGQGKISKKPNKVECECVESLLSIGEVRRKKKQQVHENDETEMQTEVKPSIKRSISRSLCLLKRSWCRSKERFQKKRKEEQVDTVILYSRDIQSREQAKFKIGARQTMSSLEVRYASIAYLKHVTFSSVDAFEPAFEPYFEPLLSESSLALKDPVSVETLFKGHQKSPTPNLGTSTLSCTSEPSCSASPKLFDKPNQAKRPFLKRLISCLVMRSDKTQRQMPQLMQPKYAPTVDSSFDSYHFSTSLGAIEMSSSLYDTSASFFSNHSVYPKNNNKMKRGFLNSMRGFLNNKRS